MAPLGPVAFFPTCVVDAVWPSAGVAAVRVLRREGAEVSVPEATCCGQPAWNAGEVEAAARVARTTLDALAATSDDTVVVVPAGSCATMMRVFWSELFELAGDHEAAATARALAPRIKEFSEFAAELEAITHGSRELLPPERAGAVVYHRSCHMLRELGIVEQPEQLLRGAGCQVVESRAQGRCCGFGGLFSVKLPEVSTAMADDILDAATDAGGREVVGCDASCLMHLRGRAEERGLALTFRHLAEVLESS